MYCVLNVFLLFSCIKTLECLGSRLGEAFGLSKIVLSILAQAKEFGLPVWAKAWYNEHSYIGC